MALLCDLMIQAETPTKLQEDTEEMHLVVLSATIIGVEDMSYLNAGHWRSEKPIPLVMP